MAPSPITGYLVENFVSTKRVPEFSISNPGRSPRFHPSPSDPFQASAFATGSPTRIKGI